MTALLEKHIAALRQIDKGPTSDLDPQLVFPLWDRCLIDVLPEKAKRTYVVNRTGKLALAAYQGDK